MNLRYVYQNYLYFKIHQKSCEVCALGERHKCSKYRVKERLAISEYRNFTLYLAYILYAPLYIAGPIITFNDFVSQLRNPIRIPIRSLALYAARWVFAVGLMEVMMHLFYVVSISKAKAWDDLSPFEMSLVGFFNLKFVWLKVYIHHVYISAAHYMAILSVMGYG
jgi:D-alanyl-lipoteichoic acid acyltransferase DltB (MBOAT superfamily)